MTDYIKRIQSSLSPNVKVSRTQIKEFMAQENIPLDNPNAAQVEAVKLYFLRGLETGSDALTTDCSVATRVEAEVGDNLQPTDLTINPDIKEMVSFKAGEMGIQLAENQIEIIASQIDSSGHSFLETISDIEAALITYIDYLHSQEASHVEEMFNRVTKRVAEKNTSIHQQLNEGVDNFRNTFEDLKKQQKKTAKSILLRLQVPLR